MMNDSSQGIHPGEEESPEDQLLKKQKLLEERCIKEGRRTASGKLIKSAEPLNYWEDENIVLPENSERGVRSLDVSILLNIKWSYITDDHVKQLFKDLGINNPNDCIEAVGRAGKYITLTVNSKELKQNIINTIAEKFPRRYRAISFEEDEAVVELYNVPSKLADSAILTTLEQYGTVDKKVTRQKDNLGFHNLRRTVVFTELKYDIPSYLKVGNHIIQPSYNLQPPTCRLCGSRKHIAVDCPKFVGPQKKKTQTPAAKEESLKKVHDKKEQQDEEIDVKEIVRVISENISLLQLHPGSQHVNNPKFRKILTDQVRRFEEVAINRQKERLQEFALKTDKDGFTTVTGRRRHGSKRTRTSSSEKGFGSDSEVYRNQRMNNKNNKTSGAGSSVSTLAKNDLKLSSSEDEQTKEKKNISESYYG